MGARDDEAVLVELDSRRRVALGKHARHARYLMRVQPGGTVILEPAVVMTELEAKLMQRPEAMRQIEEFEADPQAHRRSRRRPPAGHQADAV